jgi:hypothetical protein
MAEPILTATVSSGATWNDPSEDLLFELLSDIEAGREDFVVVDRRGHHETYAQVVLEQDGSFLMEYRAGSAQQHFAATSTDKRAIHAALTGWAFELQGWTDLLAWRPADL